ncbi:hypothetical protein [Chryseobacterium indoltheticum]|uniref:hypothetical protein n=1 Tax=Chryseobacterium indoltheticum TaxID=254 RepID=UPI003F494B71
MDKTHINDMTWNTEELQKRQEAEKSKYEANELNNSGKPPSKWLNLNFVTTENLQEISLRFFVI